MRTIVGIICIVLFTACSESREEAVYRLVKEWTGKEIKFPDHSVFTIQGKDTVTMDFHNTDFKVITYVDSIGCTSCKLQLHRWKELIAEMDSLTSGTVPFLFYFHPKDMKELRYLTRRDNFTYPVCFDEDDEFNSLNRFPSEMTFQTFLLDKENKVIGMGNPVHNPKVKELYLMKIMGENPSKADASVTGMRVDRTEYNFGTFSMAEKQECTFRLTNTGNSLLVIHDVTTSCGCTKVEYRKEPVRPGESIELRVSYEAEEKGYFEKIITVFANLETSSVRLRVRGNAE
jgi:hypothetical protein